MVQTFLPYPSFSHSLAALDYRRLGKQRAECGQILTALLRPRAEGEGPTGWSAGPVAAMWRGYESALGVYMTLNIWEWIAQGYDNSMEAPYLRGGAPNPAYAYADRMAVRMSLAAVPPWLGREDVHASHRGRLLDKDPTFYGRYGWTDRPVSEEEGYVWPVLTDKMRREAARAAKRKVNA